MAKADKDTVAGIGAVTPRRPSRIDDEEMRRQHDEAEEAYYEALERDELEKVARQRSDAIAEMAAWFDQHFEDPQNEMPYGEESNYEYPWGGPFDAAEQLHDAFNEEYPEDWIDAAVEQVTSDGTWEWGPKSSGDFYEHPDADSSGQETQEPEYRALIPAILGRLDDLEKKLEATPTRAPQLGHNNPPEDIGVPPYDDEDRTEAKLAIQAVREELNATDPNPSRISRAQETLKTIGLKVVKWSAAKADLAVDEFIKGVAGGLGKGAAAGISFGLTFVVMIQVSDDLGVFISSLINAPF